MGSKYFKPRPLGYWKDGSGKYKLMVIVKNDKYEVDEGRQEIRLKDFKLPSHPSLPVTFKAQRAIRRP
jgi:hypothetical protein